MMFRRILLVSVAALFAVAITSPVFAGATKVQGNLVHSPTVLDAGSDLTPPLATDGINDAPAIPGATGCPLPGDRRLRRRSHHHLLACARQRSQSVRYHLPAFRRRLRRSAVSRLDRRHAVSRRSPVRTA